MRAICLLATLAVCACSPADERRDRDPFVPDNNSTKNNVSANNMTTATNNASTGSNNMGTNGSPYNEYVVAMDEDCEGIGGLNGATLLAEMTDVVNVEMADLDPMTSAHINPRPLSIQIAWPADPVAVCYPQFEEDLTLVQPRLGVTGLTLTVATMDGEFSESIPGGAWLSTNDGTVGSTGVAGQISVADMQGLYMPGDEVLFANPRLSVFTTLSGPTGARGNIAFTRDDNIGLSYGSFTGRQIVIEWPYTP